MKHRKLAIMVALMFWVATAQRLSAGEYQCTETGVIGQDNFDPNLQGHFCTTTGDDASAICGTPTDVTQYCTGHCTVCGGAYASGNCTWQSSTSPGDAYATNWGCSSTQYGHFFRFTCVCNYPPQCSQPGDWCGGDNDCCNNDCVEQYNWCFTPSPILINLAGNAAYDLTSAVEGVAFDLNTDGLAERIAWTAPDSPVAFLVLDRNHNGTIDDGSELFGTATRKSDGTRAANGFDALLDLDGGTAISDGRIDAGDGLYSQLRLWVDLNHDGFSQTDELVTLPSAGVSVIFTDYRESRRRDQYGNAYRFVGKGLVSKNGKDKPILVFDVVFSVGE